MNAAQIEENEAMVMEELEKKGDSEELKLKKEQEKYETAILEKLIIKTGALLALGFGEAGAEIIAENMAKGKIKITNKKICLMIINNFNRRRSRSNAPR